MRKRLMASTAAIIIVGFLVAFALAAKLVQDQYQLEFTRRLDSILAMMESQVDDIGQDPQGFAIKIGRELQEKGVDTDFETVLEDIRRRDYQDSHRATAPLRQAEDAVLVDTSEMDLEESFQALKSLILSRV